MMEIFLGLPFLGEILIFLSAFLVFFLNSVHSAILGKRMPGQISTFPLTFDEIPYPGGIKFKSEGQRRRSYPGPSRSKINPTSKRLTIASTTICLDIVKPILGLNHFRSISREAPSSLPFAFESNSGVNL